MLEIVPAFAIPMLIAFAYFHCPPDETLGKASSIRMCVVRMP